VRYNQKSPRKKLHPWGKERKRKDEGGPKERNGCDEGDLRRTRKEGLRKSKLSTMGGDKNTTKGKSSTGKDAGEKNQKTRLKKGWGKKFDDGIGGRETKSPSLDRLKRYS